MTAARSGFKKVKSWNTELTNRNNKAPGDNLENGVRQDGVEVLAQGKVALWLVLGVHFHVHIHIWIAIGERCS
jgi:hypothetical protein